VYPDLLLRQNIPLRRVLAVRKHNSLFFHNYNQFRALRQLSQLLEVTDGHGGAHRARHL